MSPDSGGGERDHPIAGERLGHNGSGERSNDDLTTSRRNGYGLPGRGPDLVETGPVFYFILAALLLFFFFIYLMIRRTLLGFKGGVETGRDR